jgi:hypothetical protein
MSQLFYLMLCMFYNGFKCFSGVFANFSDACFKCFISLQMYVASVVSGCSKVDRVLHFRLCLLLSRPSPPGVGWATKPEAQAGAAPLFLMLVMFGQRRPPREALETECRSGRPDVRALAPLK